MPTTATLVVADTDVLTPFEGDISPVKFGVEHEYNFTPGHRRATEPPNEDDQCLDDSDACGCWQCLGGTPQWNRRGQPQPTIPPGWVQHEEHCGWEIKTGIEDNVPAVMAEFTRLEHEMSCGHANCGLHIHINGNPTRGGAVNPAVFAANFQRFKRQYLYPAIAGETGLTARHGHWAPSLGGQSVEQIFERTIHGEIAVGQLSQHGTIEVRLHGGTSDMAQFERWLRLVLGLAAISMYDEGEGPLNEPVIVSTAARAPGHFLNRYMSLCGIASAEVVKAHRLMEAGPGPFRDSAGRFCSAEVVVQQRLDAEQAAERARQERHERAVRARW